MTDGARPAKHNAVDMTGVRYGYLTGVRRDHKRGKSVYWLMRCDCGAEVVRNGQDVRRGNTLSCGCKRGALRVETRGTHGMSGHPAFAVWRSMLDRCRLPSHQAWHNYGARGIAVCERWQTSFENFWADMGPAYRRGLTLDRKDNNGHYTPSNCRWVTSRVQANNTGFNRIVETPDGEMTVAQASRRYGVKQNTILYRLGHGWPDTKAVTTPPNFRNSRYTI
mgnify:CR=1 FL=1